MSACLLVPLAAPAQSSRCTGGRAFFFAPKNISILNVSVIDSIVVTIFSLIRRFADTTFATDDDFYRCSCLVHKLHVVVNVATQKCLMEQIAL